MINNVKYKTASKEELSYLENAYNEFKDKYDIKFDGKGNLLIQNNSENSEIEIILKENWGENRLNVFNKGSKDKLIEVPPYSKYAPTLDVNGQVFRFKHESNHEKPAEKFHASYWFPGSRGQW